MLDGADADDLLELFGPIDLETASAAQLLSRDAVTTALEQLDWSIGDRAKVVITSHAVQMQAAPKDLCNPRTLAAAIFSIHS